MNTQLSQHEIETKWQNAWKANKVFSPQITSQEKYFINVPYPYANSALHIGHGRTYVASDILARFQRLVGKNVLYPLAFHMSGTPVLAVADGVKRNDPKIIAQLHDVIQDDVPDKQERDSIIASFTDPHAIGSFFENTIQDGLESIGTSIDWSRRFTTGDAIYQKFITWVFKKLHQQGAIKQGEYPILYSQEDKNAVGEDDIKDGDVDPVSISEMTGLFFVAQHKQFALFPATLRPETVYGCTNLWIAQNTEYIIATAPQLPYNIIISKDAFVKLQNQINALSLVRSITLEEIRSTQYIVPLSSRPVPVIPTAFVKSDHGTGVVYSVPAHAPYDYTAFIEAQKEFPELENVKPIRIIDIKDKKGNILEGIPAQVILDKYKHLPTHEQHEEATKDTYKQEFYHGYFNEACGEYNGKLIKDVKDNISQRLGDEKYACTVYETSRKAWTRGGSVVTIAVLNDQWFLDYTAQETKEKTYALLTQMDYYPDQLKDSQMKYLEWVERRPCTRKRGVGTLFPFDTQWVIEPLSDSTVYQLFYLIAGIINQHDIPASGLTDEFFDYVFNNEGTLEAAVSSSNIESTLVEQMYQQVNYWEGFDLRYTNPPHMSNHLAFLLYHYALIIRKELHPHAIYVGGLMIINGEKMSKSKNNIIPLKRASHKFGADMFRLYVAITASLETELDFSEKEIADFTKQYNKLIKMLQDALEHEANEYSNYKEIDQWLISKFYSKAKAYFTYMDNYKVREAYIMLFHECIHDIQYHTRKTNYKQTMKVLRFFLQDYLRLLTPVIPHICEELNTLPKEFISLQQFTTDCQQYINCDLEEQEEIIKITLQNISSTLFTLKDKSCSQIEIITAPEHRYKLFADLKKLLTSTTEFKEVMQPLMQSYAHDAKFIKKFVPKTLSGKIHYFMSQDEEYQLLQANKAFFEQETGITIHIKHYDPKTPISAVGLVPSRPFIKGILE